jgi:alkylation response protein AidB-like acyl-CoA dehydrogenase
MTDHGESNKKLSFANQLSPAKTLFLGNLATDVFFPYPTISGEERETIEMIIDSVDRFMSSKGEDYRRYDREGSQPDQYVQALREMGLFGLIIGEEYGGIGLSNSGYSRVLQQTSRYDASTSLTIGAHSSIGMKGLILFGNEEQKKRYLPKLASGQMIAAFCLTEPGSGSDAASIKTTAKKNSDGTWLLNGEKIWITNGGTADFFTVFAKTDTAGGKMSAFIVERSFKGLSNGPKEDKMGIRASCTTTVQFNDLIVPAENLLGEEGKGFKVAMAILNNGRTGLGGGCVGAMKRLIEVATKQAIERKQFGKSIAEFGLVQEKIAQMTINCFAAESVVTMVGHLIDHGHEDYSTEAAISKIFASEALWSVCYESLQIAGGNGFMREYPYERVTRDSRINLIFEGTNEILRLYIALNGMKEAGDYLKDVSKSLAGVFNDPIKGFGVLSEYGKKKFSQYTTLGQAKFNGAHQDLAEEALAFERYTAQLGKATESLLRKYGKGVVEQQMPMKRVADIVIDIFVGLCVIARVSALLKDKNARELKDELSIAQIFTKQAKRRINQNFRRLDRNEDSAIVALAESIVKQQGYRWDIFK